MMLEIQANTLPQTAPISDMRNRQNELLHMAENGPVILLSRSKPAAVLLSPAQWDALANALAVYRQRAEVAEQLVASTAAYAKGDTTEVDALAAIAALAQPLGPSDLASNFDLYTKRVLNDELPENGVR
ncbi:MAG: type II toxin-antitoxin system prevent-host-death family antitoxin [Caldilineaceae bacterium]